MGYRNILVQIDDGAPSKDRAAAAATLAKRFGASLTGVFLKSEFLAIYGAGDALAFMPPENISLLLDEQAQAVARAAAAARPVFEQAAMDAGVAHEWLEIEGDGNDQLLACARRSDLCIFPAQATASIGAHRVGAGVLGLASGGPVLVMPNHVSGERIGKKVLVAWKESRESARAVNDAWPFLAEADEVHVLRVGGEAETAPDPLLERHFKRHACKSVKMIVDRGPDSGVGDILRRQIGIIGADLVVMGLYGRPRLQEVIFGGVSRDLLEALPVPLLVSH